MDTYSVISAQWRSVVVLIRCWLGQRLTYVKHIRPSVLLTFSLVTAICASGQAQDTLDVVKSIHPLGPQNLSFLSGLATTARWGDDVEGIGDLDGDGVQDMIVGQASYNSSRGAMWLLFLNDTGGVKSHRLISNGLNGFGSVLDASDGFGTRLSLIGDLDTNGVADIAVLAPGDDDGSTDRGAVYVLFMTDSGTVHHHRKISDTAGSFLGNMSGGNEFNATLEGVGDMDGDALPDIAIGSYQSDNGGSGRGAFWLLHLDTAGAVKSHIQYSSTTTTWPGGTPIANGDNFGFSVAGIGDLNNDGYRDLAVTSRFTSNGAGKARGRIYILFLNASGGVISIQAIAPGGVGGLTSNLTFNGGHFGWSIDDLGDLNADGVKDLLIGVRLESIAYTNDGCAVVAYLNTNGTVQYDEMISESHGLSSGSLGLANTAYFGYAVAKVGDVDGDHVTDIVVSANNHPAGGTSKGKVYLLELNPKPVLLRPEITNETLTAHGSIELDIVGGVRPYELIWADSIPSEATFDDWVASVDTTGLASLGIEDIEVDALTRAEYLALYEPDLDSVMAGHYHLTVIDATHDTISRWLHVGSTLVTNVATNTSVVSERTITKTTSAGWSNMEFTTKNFLYAGEDGWISFVVPDSSEKLAVGLRTVGATKSSGYQHMTYAFVFSNDSIKLWFDGSLHTTPYSYDPGDSFDIKRTGKEIEFAWNHHTLDTIHRNTGTNVFAGEVAIYTGSAKVTDLAMSRPYTFLLTDSIHHVDALFPYSGSIDLAIKPGTGTYTMTWEDSSTGSVHDELAPEQHSASIASSYFGHTRTIGFEVGNALYWQLPQAATSTTTRKGVDISHGFDTLGWGSALRSVNMSRDLNGHWLSFEPCSDRSRDDATICGWAERATKDPGALWFTVPFGGQHLAYAIAPSGVVAHAILRSPMNIGMRAADDSLTFHVNDRIIATILAPGTESGWEILAALKDSSSYLAAVKASSPAPLALNTAFLPAGYQFDVTGPGIDGISSTTGSIASVDLGAGPDTAYYNIEVEATDTTDVFDIDLKLDSGRAVYARIVHAATIQHLGTALYHTHGPNTVALYDESESYEYSEQTFEILLEDGILMTPNDDSYYDELRVVGVSTAHLFGLVVFDLEMNIVFQTDDPEEAWNGRFMNTGTPLSDGVYRYDIAANGELITDQLLLKN